jgi:precorrin-6A synthase
MRTVSVIGIGAGDPRQVTVQAIDALNTVDAVFMIDKGAQKQDLSRLRREICERYITGTAYRIVAVADPERDRTAADYRSAVGDWRARRVEIYERLIAGELGEHEHGAFLAWGDPAIYDGTLDMLGQVRARGMVNFGLEVIPGISSVQALAARHQVSLTQTGQPVQLTTGRRLAQGLAGPDGDVVVMLDSGCAFTTLEPDGLDIYWGAYVGTDDEILISGKLADVAGDIVAAREAARRRHGWIMDSYLLRRDQRGDAAPGAPEAD